MPPDKNATSDTGILSLTRISVSLSNIILIPLLTKSLGVEGYGIWVQAWVLIPLFASVLKLGLPSAMTRFFHQKERAAYTKDFYKIIFTVIPLTIPLTLIIWISAPFFPESLFDGNVRVIRVVALIIPITMLGELFHSLLLSLRKMWSYGVSSIVKNIFELGLASTLIILGWGIEGAIIAILVVRSIFFVAIALFCTQYLEGHSWRGTSISQYLDFGLPLIPMNVSSWALSYIDRFLIALMLGTAAVGYYDPAYIIGSSVPLIMGEVMRAGLLPSLSRLYDKGTPSQVQKTLTFMLKMLLLLCIPYIVGGCLLGKPILELFTIPIMAEQGTRVLPLVSLALTLHGCKVVISQGFYLEKRTKIMGWSYSLAAISNAAFTFALIPLWGIEGAAVATVMAYLLDLLITLHYSSHTLLPKDIMAPLAKIMASSAIMLAAITLTLRATPYELFLPLIVGIITYFACVVGMSVLNEEESSLIRTIAPWTSHKI